MIDLPLPGGLELVRADGVWAGLAQLRALVETDRVPTAVVLGPALQRPLDAARQLHNISPDSHLVLLCPSGGETLRRALRFDPNVGSDWTVLDAAAVPAIAERLAEVRLAALQRRKVRRTFDTMSERVGRHRAPTVAERLSATEGALATILTNSFDAVVSCDASGRVLAWNRAAEAIFGTPDSEAVGTFVHDLLPVAADIAARMEGAREPTFVACGHGDRELEMRIAPMRGMDQDFLGLVVVARDVTEWRRAERASKGE